MTDTTPATIKARRGDLVVIECKRSDYVIGQGAAETTTYTVELVTSVTRAGEVKAVRNFSWGDDSAVQPVSRIIGLSRVIIVSKDDIDVPGAMAQVRTHTYPGHTQPMPYATLTDVRDALRPFRTGVKTAPAHEKARIVESVEKREVCPGIVIDVTWFDLLCPCGYRPGVGYTSRDRIEELREIHGRECRHSR